MTEQRQFLSSACGPRQWRQRNGCGRRSKDLLVAATFFLPTLLFALTVNLGMAVQTGMLVADLREVEGAQVKLSAGVNNTRELRALLNKVVAVCAKAGSEDAKAKLIIDVLAKHGITMTTDVVVR